MFVDDEKSSKASLNESYALANRHCDILLSPFCFMLCLTISNCLSSSNWLLKRQKKKTFEAKIAARTDIPVA